MTERLKNLPGENRWQFIDAFCKAMKCQPGTIANVIDFEYVPRKE